MPLNIENAPSDKVFTGTEEEESFISKTLELLLPINTTFGPENTKLIQSGIDLKIDGMHRSTFLEKGGIGPREIIPTDDPEDFIDIFQPLLKELTPHGYYLEKLHALFLNHYLKNI